MRICLCLFFHVNLNCLKFFLNESCAFEETDQTGSSLDVFCVHRLSAMPHFRGPVWPKTGGHVLTTACHMGNQSAVF